MEHIPAVVCGGLRCSVFISWQLTRLFFALLSVFCATVTTVCVCVCVHAHACVCVCVCVCVRVCVWVYETCSTSQQKHYDIVLKKKEARLELLRNPRKYRHFNKVQGVFTSERFYCSLMCLALPGSKKLLLFQVSISRHDAIIRLSHSYAHHKLKANP